jgi:hypothetical protein
MESRVCWSFGANIYMFTTDCYFHFLSHLFSSPSLSLSLSLFIFQFRSLSLCLSIPFSLSISLLDIQLHFGTLAWTNNNWISKSFDSQVCLHCLTFFSIVSPTWQTSSPTNGWKRSPTTAHAKKRLNRKNANFDVLADTRADALTRTRDHTATDAETTTTMMRRPLTITTTTSMIVVREEDIAVSMDVVTKRILGFLIADPTILPTMLLLTETSMLLCVTRLLCHFDIYRYTDVDTACLYYCLC